MQSSRSSTIVMLFIMACNLSTHVAYGNQLNQGAFFEKAYVNAVCQFHVIRKQIDYLVPYSPAHYEEVRGTGFFISPDGEIITNSHVVLNATSVSITLPACGKKRIPVEVIGQCPERDIALVKLTEEGFNLVCDMLGVDEIPYLILDDSDSISRLDNVYAIGYPLGQSGLKTTKGVVSGPENLRVGFAATQSFIQMDAAINPGSSGGPLLNRAGYVIGITTAAYIGASGVGYIIPINDLKFLLDDLREKPLVFRPYLGMFCNRSSDEHARYLSNPVPAGLFIYFVQPYSIADCAGIKAGDMLYQLNEYFIDEFGETTVDSSSEKTPLNQIVSKLKVGDEIVFQVYRNGQCLELSTTCIEPPQYTGNFQYGSVDYEILGGMTVMHLCENHFDVLPINPYLLEYACPEKMTESVLLITNILPGTEMYRNGQLIPGILIDEINEVPVKTLDEFREAVRLSKESGILVLKARGGMSFAFSYNNILKDQYDLIEERICPPTKLFLQLRAMDEQYRDEN